MLYATGIYTIESPSGKMYVGQSRNLKHRLYCYATGRTKYQVKIHNSILKHGWNAHRFTVVFSMQIGVDQKTLNYWEQFFIDYYRSQGIELLNIKEAGAKGKHSEESKQKMSHAKKGRKVSDEHRRKLSIAARRYYSDETIKQQISLAKKGRKHSEETKLKISIAGRGNQNSKGHIDSAETRRKRNAANTGKQHSAETKSKMSVAQKKRWAKHSV